MQIRNAANDSLRKSLEFREAIRTGRKFTIPPELSASGRSKERSMQMRGALRDPNRYPKLAQQKQAELNQIAKQRREEFRARLAQG